MILEKIAADTRELLAEKKGKKPLKQVEQEARCAPESAAPSFAEAIRGPGISFICEVKRASPSKGVIAPVFPYLEIAREYVSAGASAISVLTEQKYFLGQDRYLTEIAAQAPLPVLRKDFTVDPYQIFEARILGAKAVLLICALLEKELIREFLAIAEDLGLSAIVEAHDEREVETALSAGSRIIGVNNRDLKTFTVDMETSIRCRSLVPRDVLYISESGIETPEDMKRLEEAGVDAVLIGETLMRSTDKRAALKHLRSQLSVGNTGGKYDKD